KCANSVRMQLFAFQMSANKCKECAQQAFREGCAYFTTCLSSLLSAISTSLTSLLILWCSMHRSLSQGEPRRHWQADGRVSFRFVPSNCARFSSASCALPMTDVMWYCVGILEKRKSSMRRCVQSSKKSLERFTSI